MTLYAHRERFEDLSIKIGVVFSKLGISPNTWTMISLVPAIASVYFLYHGQFMPAALLFIISASIDMVDGAVARVTGKATMLGAYLDTIVDRYVEFLVMLGIILSGLPGFIVPAYAWVFVLLFGSMMTTYAKSAATEKGITKAELKGGLLERAERLIILFVGMLLATIDPLYLTYVIILLAVLTNVSAIQRISIAIRLSQAA